MPYHAQAHIFCFIFIGIFCLETHCRAHLHVVGNVLDYLVIVLYFVLIENVLIEFLVTLTKKLRPRLGQKLDQYSVPDSCRPAAISVKISANVAS